ncbi:hypothetical protein QCI42_29165 [Bacillus fungorum]|uniref:hypothetical protein n=1 Tax=Bacillus fungorum TaxID=2039284 RepID=UPI0033982424
MIVIDRLDGLEEYVMDVEVNGKLKDRIFLRRELLLHLLGGNEKSTSSFLIHIRG